MRSSRRFYQTSLTMLASLCMGATPLYARTEASVAAVAVVNAASYESQVAPGSIAALFGSAMTAQAGIAAGTLPLPTTLAGLSVKVNGVLAPLFYASAGQINLQIPGSIAVGTAAIEVFATGSATPVATGSATVSDSAPGVFTADSSGHNQAAALNSDYSLNADFDKFPGSRPEVTGKYVTIFATGVGNTNPAVPDGQAALASPLAVATSTTTVTIGGVAAEVVYSGLAPGYVGLWQINAFLPQSLSTNLATSLKVELRSRSGPQTTLAVASKNEFGDTNGSVVNAVSGSPIAGAAVSFTPSAGSTIRTATTDALGHFSIAVIAAGNYTVSAGATGFITATQAASITGSQAESLAPIPLSAPLTADQYRIVVTWKTSSPDLDLDAHLTGPGSGGGRFHVWWNGEADSMSVPTARLDRDDLSGLGPETVTFSPQGSNGYKFSVHNYSDRDTPGNTRLFAAHPVARVYRGNQQVAVLSPPGGGGTLWKILELVGTQVTIVNQLSDEYEPSNIKISY